MKFLSSEIQNQSHLNREKELSIQRKEQKKDSPLILYYICEQFLSDFEILQPH